MDILLRKDAQAQEMSQRLQKSKDGKRQAGQVVSMREKFPEIISISSSYAREGDWENIITAHKDETLREHGIQEIKESVDIC